ncbi:MAG: hypothetical protein JSR98_17060 [Proteobacteria bacterium]|nr:hypothetical protein [Pseudomonadota bacterium]
MDPQLLNGNTFGCGQPVRWIVLLQSGGGKSLEMDTFSGAQMPTSIRATGYCGTYFYARP